ncbi:MAG: cytochrome-c peroxidase, partial [Phycisphaerae bacterium]
MRRVTGTVGWSVLLITAAARVAAGLPPVPVPPENRITEPKRVLGKILFWDERLSSNDTVACGTCHILGAGGGDPRPARHPGFDGVFDTDDDIVGSLGIPRADENNVPCEDFLFGWEPQVTGRAAPTMIGAMYAEELFWDGRASTTFYNPETGAVSIPSGGALENQALGPILNDLEMSHENRDWPAVTAKLAGVRPLSMATDWPPDVEAALAGGATYSDLFEAAFGDPAMTAERLAFAIATYERTLVADQTPWDRFMAGDADALTRRQKQAWSFYQSSTCFICHMPPFFTDFTYRNIGLRPVVEDPGRQARTGLAEDRGKFKVPTLRNVGLKATFMHTGGISRMRDVILFYLGLHGEAFFDNRDPVIVKTNIPAVLIDPLADFIANGLTDPRVAAETFPFDRPTLQSERVARFDEFADCF